MKIVLAIALCASIGAAAHAQQPDFAKVQIQVEKLADSVHMLTGAGGNMAVSVGDDTFLVDDQFAPLTPKIKAAIAKLSPKPVKFVLNTHWHFDHAGGNENFARAGSVIVAHENTRKRMSSDQLIGFLSMPVKPSPKGALPVVTFASDVVFHLNGDEVHAFHVPKAHTDGDVVVHFRRSNVVHLGDVFFNKLYPFIDTSSGGSLAGTLGAIDRVLALINDDTKVIPGHGPLATKAELAGYREMLFSVGERIKAQIGAGKSLEETVASKPTREFDDGWGKGFLEPDKFVSMLWADLKR